MIGGSSFVSGRKVRTVLVGLALRRGLFLFVSVFSIKYEAGLATVKRLWGEVIDVRRGEKV